MQIHLGNGIMVEEEKFEWALRNPTDSRFCKHLARTLWSDEELEYRNLTGEKCSRLKEAGTEGPVRLPATPIKLEAIQSELSLWHVQFSTANFKSNCQYR